MMMMMMINIIINSSNDNLVFLQNLFLKEVRKMLLKISQQNL